MIHRILAAAAFGSAAFASSVPEPIEPALALPTQETAGEATYLRTRTVSVVRNFPDQNGSSLSTLPAGTLVRGFRVSEGKPPFREVEVAGGFPVWVYGKYLQPTDVDGVLLVTGSRVNMRPSPDLTPNSMALRSKLEAGQRVKLIERAGRAAALGEDWVRVQAPPTARAWVLADALTAIEPVAAAAEWTRANPPLPTRPARTATAATRPASASGAANADVTPAISASLLDELAAADRAYDAADSLRSPTAEAWRDVVIAYEGVVAKAPAGSVTRQNATQRLERARVQMEVAALREDYNAKAREHDDEVDKINRYLDEQRMRKTARWGRFAERGWLQARKIAGERRYFLIFSGSTMAEVRCASARYDLSLFEGFEIGVLGDEIAPSVSATPTSRALARIIDIERIEVISGSSMKR
ncbi:MAG: hypothetical protein AAF957_06930 [Planctomycetota bacterium]